MVERRGDIEAIFRRAGLPLFIEDRSAKRDVWTRAMPLLVLVFWLEMFGAVDLSWSAAANVAAVLGGIAILGTAWIVANLARGRRPLQRPNDIGAWELAGFVVIPALLPAVINGQTTSSLVTLLVNLALLGLIYGVIALGLVSILRWSGRHLAQQLAGALMLFARAIPLLLLFNLVLILTTEFWQVFADMRDAQMIATIVLLLAAAAAFVVAQLPREVRKIEADVGQATALESRQLANVGLVMFVAQAVQALVVTAAVWLFFVVFGFIAIDQAVMREWLGHGVESLFEFNLGGQQLVLSTELLRVATAIAAFSGLYYAIAVLIDTTYRSQFLDGVTREMREVFSLRERYLRSLRTQS
jgi:hypothetical protein